MEEENKEETGIIRDEQGRFVPGLSGNPEGRPPDTQEQKLTKKAIEVLVKEYKETLADVLPELSPILKVEALKGNIAAIKELHDRVMGKAEQKTDLYIKEAPKPILNVIQPDNSNKEDTSSQE